MSCSLCLATQSFRGGGGGGTDNGGNGNDGVGSGGGCGGMDEDGLCVFWQTSTCSMSTEVCQHGSDVERQRQRNDDKACR